MDGPDHATSDIAIGSGLGVDVTRKLPHKGLKRPWSPVIKIDSAVKAKVEKILGKGV